ncbi:MAG: class B sortase [Lachnospiraceae bacterium]
MAASKEHDAAFELEVQRQLKKRESRRKWMLIALSVIAVASIGYFIFYYYIADHSDSAFGQLADLKHSEVLNNPTPVMVDEQGVPKPILEKYQTLYNKNKSLVAWVKIEGTEIDYPVMQSVNQEYYLNHNYSQEKDKNGSIFMDKNCDAMKPSMNLIIYGHNMKSGKMFGTLERYAKSEFYEKYPMIQFDTIYEEGQYQIMYVFRSKLYSEEEIVFKYYQFVDAPTEEEFYSNMNEMAALSLYDTGVTAAYGDSLITLSTCDYQEDNGRFVVVAKKIA